MMAKRNGHNPFNTKYKTLSPKKALQDKFREFIADVSEKFQTFTTSVASDANNLRVQIGHAINTLFANQSSLSQSQHNMNLNILAHTKVLRAIYEDIKTIKGCDVTSVENEFHEALARALIEVDSELKAKAEEEEQKKKEAAERLLKQNEEKVEAERIEQELNKAEEGVIQSVGGESSEHPEGAEIFGG